jgi:phosphotransferase system IIB component
MPQIMWNIKYVIHLLKELNVKIATDSIIQKEKKLKAKGCYKTEKQGSYQTCVDIQ